MLTTGADSWGAAQVSPSLFWFLSKYEDTQGLTRDIGWEWAEGPIHWVGGLVSCDTVEHLAVSLAELNMAVCMHRISLSWSPDTFALLDWRFCLLAFWGEEESEFAGTGSETGVIGGSAEHDAVLGFDCVLGVAAGDTQSSMTSFSSSESPVKARSSSLFWTEPSFICSDFGTMVSLTTGWVVSSVMELSISVKEVFISSELLQVFTSCSMDLLVLLLTLASCSFCILVVLLGVVSPNVSRSVRSTAKSRPLFSKHTKFLWELSWWETEKRNNCSDEIRPHTWYHV